MALKLEGVKQTLDLLVQQAALTPEQQQIVLAGIKDGTLKGHSGEFVVNKGWVPQAVLTATLKEQAALKAEAAVADIDSIIQNGRQDIPVWLKVNIGNNGINPAAAQPSVKDGASAAANIAQNLVVMANAAPELAPQLKKSIESASALALFLAGEQAEKPPLEVLKRWQHVAGDGLRKAARYFESPEGAAKANLHNNPAGQQVPSFEQIKDFLGERNKEISSALEITLPWQARNQPGTNPDGPSASAHL